MTSAPTSVDIGTLIWKSPAKGGRACLAGQNITVSRIVNLWREPLTPEQVAEDAFGLDVVSVADVYAALAYYHSNQAEIDNEIAEAQRDHDKAYKEHKRRLKSA
ncbi:MAG: DUF433 domain-containing protein [Dehalococcoidia bacterium]